MSSIQYNEKIEETKYANTSYQHLLMDQAQDQNFKYSADKALEKITAQAKSMKNDISAQQDQWKQSTKGKSKHEMQCKFKISEKKYAFHTSSPRNNLHFGNLKTTQDKNSQNLMQAPKGKVIKSFKISKTSIPTHLKGLQNSLKHMFM